MSPSCFPPAVPYLDAPLPSTGSPQVRVPLLPRYYQGAATPCVLPTGLGCPCPAVPLSLHARFAPPGGACAAGGRGLLRLRAGSPLAGWYGGDDRASHVPEEPRLCLCPALRPRRDRTHQAITARPVLPPLKPPRRLPHCQFRGSITRLRHSLSPPRSVGYPTTTQDSLPAAGLALPDGLAYPQGSNERFLNLRLHLILLSQALRDARFVW